MTHEEMRNAPTGTTIIDRSTGYSYVKVSTQQHKNWHSQTGWKKLNANSKSKAFIDFSHPENCALEPAQPVESPEEFPLTHGRSCAAWKDINGVDVGGQCTCGLRYRIQLQTEQTMHAAWRKRAEEAEALIENRRAVPVEERTLSMAVREQLWASHGCFGIYGDDGEMQCCFRQPFIDFKRDSEEKILEGCRIHAMERLKLAAPVPEERTAEMELLHKEIDETPLTTGTREMFHRLADHIEGKAK